MMSHTVKKSISAAFLVVVFFCWSHVVWAQLRNDPFNPLPNAQSGSFPTDSQTFWGHEDAQREGRHFAPFVFAGGLHATSASLTSAAFGTEAFVPERVNQVSTAITYTTSTTNICFTIISSQNTSIASWTRVGTSAYYFFCQGEGAVTPIQPTLPANSAWLLRVTITSGAITAVLDKANRVFTPENTTTFTTSMTTDLHTLWQCNRGMVVIASGITITHQGTFIGDMARCITLQGTGQLLLPNQPFAYPQWWGAVADTTIDSALALEQTFASNAPHIVLTGVFGAKRNILIGRSNLFLRGSSIAAGIVGITPFVNTSNLGILTFGLTPSLVAVSVSNITIRDLTLGGGSGPYATALYMSTATDVVIDNIIAKDGGDSTALTTTGGCIRFYNSQDIKVSNSRISHCVGKFGDGLLFGGVTNGSAINNTVTNVQRICVVSENNGGSLPKSTNILMLGNNCSNTNNSLLTEINAAYWVENTVGARIIGNYGDNLENTPANPSRGIVIGSQGTSTPATFIIQGNVIRSAIRGMTINADAIDTVLVDGFVFDKNTINFCNGIFITGGKIISIANVFIGPNTYGASCGAVLIDNTSGTAMTQFRMTNSLVSGSIFGVTNAADFKIINLTNSPALEIALTGLRGWKIQLDDSPSVFTIIDSELRYDGGYSGTAFSAINRLEVRDTVITAISTVGPRGFRGQNASGAVAVFNNVIFVGVVPTIANGGTINHTIQFLNCLFRTGSALEFNGAFTIDIDGTRFDDYHLTIGAIHTNFSNFPFNLRIRNSDFNAAGSAVEPIQLWNFNPTTFVYSNVTYSTGEFTTMALAPALPTTVHAQGIISGKGTPEGNIQATKGTLYLRLDGGANTTLYIKESGGGTFATGWVAK